MGFRATLNVRKFKVALNSTCRLFLYFAAKSCILTWLSKFYNKKKFHRNEFLLECAGNCFEPP